MTQDASMTVDANNTIAANTFQDSSLVATVESAVAVTGVETPAVFKGTQSWKTQGVSLYTTAAPSSRRLASHALTAEGKAKARSYNLFAGAIAEAVGAASCDSMATHNKIGAGYLNGTQDMYFSTVGACYVQLRLQGMSGSGNAWDTTGNGYCIANMATWYPSNAIHGQQSQHQSCVMEDGSGGFSVKTKLTVPKSKLSDASAPLANVDPAAAIAANAAAFTESVQKSTIVAVAIMANDPQTSGAFDSVANLTAAFGVSSTAIAAVWTQVDAANTAGASAAPTSVDAVLTAASVNFATEKTAMSAALPMNIQVTAQTSGNGGSTSDACRPGVVMMAFVAVMMKLLF